MIFLDAGPLIAFFNRRDNYHQSAVSALKYFYEASDQMTTTNRIISEVYDAIRCDKRISKKKDSRPALIVFEAVSKATGFLTVEFLDAVIEKKAIAVLKAYPDQNFSFCDACSFALIDHNKMRDVYTLDQKDFRVYKFRRKLNFID